jgi:hypothetical protein
MEVATRASDAGSAPADTPQHLLALERANRVRIARAELKRKVGRGEVDVEEVLERPPWEAETMSVAELLRSQRRWGEVRTRRLLAPLRIVEERRLGALTRRQRVLVSRELAAHRAGSR